MNAFKFKEELDNIITKFFNTCKEQETIDTERIKDITCYIDDNILNLRLETDQSSYTQDFEVDEEITPLYFEIH